MTEPNKLFSIAELEATQIFESKMALDLAKQLADTMRKNERLEKELLTIAKSTSDPFAMQCATNALNRTRIQKMSDKLLPCPFCGSSDNLEFIENRQSDFSFRIRCINCDSFSFDHNCTRYSEPSPEAVAAWNTRNGVSNKHSEMISPNPISGSFQGDITKYQRQQPKNRVADCIYSNEDCPICPTKTPVVTIYHEPDCYIRGGCNCPRSTN